MPSLSDFAPCLGAYLYVKLSKYSGVLQVKVEWEAKFLMVVVHLAEYFNTPQKRAALRDKLELYLPAEVIFESVPPGVELQALTGAKGSALCPKCGQSPVIHVLSTVSDFVWCPPPTKKSAPLESPAALFSKTPPGTCPSCLVGFDACSCL